MRLRRGGASDLGDVCGFTRLGTDLVLEIRNSQAPTPESVALSRDIVCLCLSPSHGVGIPLTESGVRSGEDDPGSPRVQVMYAELLVLAARQLGGLLELDLLVRDGGERERVCEV